MLISVPLCYLPNSRAQVFDMATCKRSLTQVQTLKDVSQRPDFAYFICTMHNGQDFIAHPDYSSTFYCTWVDRSGRYHAGHISPARGLGPNGWRAGLTADPVPLDHVVYKSRCVQA